MKKNWKRVGFFTLALIMVTMLLPISSFKAQAEKGEDDSEALGATYKAGDIIRFGHYEQDGNTANGKEEIEWQVLKVESNRVLVVSKYALDAQPYNTEYTNATWETCTLRKWLNNDFKKAAFTSAEQTKIPSVTVVNKRNPYWGHTGGNNTQDQIFCLSTDEIKELFGYNWYNDKYMYGFSQKMLVEATPYALKNGVCVGPITEEDYDCGNDEDFCLKNVGYTRDVIGLCSAPWWLRSAGSSPSAACYVHFIGRAGDGCISNVNNQHLYIRPALYIIDPPIVVPKSITLNKTSATINYGASLTLTATVLPADSMDKSVTWNSSNASVATVNGGVVKATGKQAGAVSITAKTVNGLTAKCEVTVYADNNSSNSFADIKYGSWQYNAAKPVYEKGYMTGKGTLGKRILFDPNSNIDRSQFVTALYSMEGKPAVTYVQKFSDVKSGAWYANAVTWASNNGIVAGNPDGTFGVSGKATREQMAQMLYKYAQYKHYDVSVKASTDLSGFSDANKISSWAVTAVKWAVERGIISGKGSAGDGYRVAPAEKASRIECAAMINKFSEVYANAPKMGDEDLEEPLALPEEEIEDVPVPADETEDVIIDEDEEEGDDEDVPSKDEKDTKEEEIKDEPAEDNEK